MNFRKVSTAFLRWHYKDDLKKFLKLTEEINQSFWVIIYDVTFWNLLAEKSSIESTQAEIESRVPSDSVGVNFGQNNF